MRIRRRRGLAGRRVWRGGTLSVAEGKRMPGRRGRTRRRRTAEVGEGQAPARGRRASVEGGSGSSGSGGSLADARTGGEEGSPRWSRILRATGPSSMTETTRIRPAQRAQVRISRAKTRLPQRGPVDPAQRPAPPAQADTRRLRRGWLGHHLVSERGAGSQDAVLCGAVDYAERVAVGAARSGRPSLRAPHNRRRAFPPALGSEAVGGIMAAATMARPA